MHHQTILLTLLSVTPLFAIPLPQGRVAITNEHASDAIKRSEHTFNGGVGPATTFTIARGGASDFARRDHHLKLSLASGSEPATAIKRDEVMVAVKPAYSPLRDSVTAVKRAPAPCMDGLNCPGDAWIVGQEDDARIVGQEDSATIVKRVDLRLSAAGEDEATIVKRAPSPCVDGLNCPGDAWITGQESDAWIVAKEDDTTIVKRNDIKLSAAGEDDATFTKRQEYNAWALGDATGSVKGDAI